MKRTTAFIAPVACACVVALGACGGGESASSATPADTDRQATQLVTRLFQDVKEKDTADLEAFLDPSWQLRRADGDRLTKSEYIAGLPDLRGYSISGVRGTANGPALVASYTATTDLVVDGQTYKGTPAPYLASFVKVDGRWRMISQANFNVPQE
jgi:hypothetical protein